MKECPVCRSKDNRIYIVINDYKILYCFSCEILFTAGKFLPPLSINNQIYDSDYINNYQAKGKEIKDRFRKHLDKIEQHKNGGKILDIGCGLGYFLKVAEESKRCRWEVYGVELNKRLAEIARVNCKGKINIGNLEKLPFSSNYFDCVTCFDVLEHNSNFFHNLDEIKRVLKRGGILVIQSPNYKSLMRILTGANWDWWLAPDHLLHFSPKFLIRELNKHGYSISQLFTYELQKDFLINIKGTWKKTLFGKVSYILLMPILLFLEKIGWLFDFGGLVFVIATKK